jgi:hypothetical protein
MEMKKEPKILMAATFSDPKEEVFNLKASFKNRVDKIFIWTAMKSRQTAERRIFFFVKIGFSPNYRNYRRKTVIIGEVLIRPEITKSIFHFVHRK